LKTIEAKPIIFDEKKIEAGITQMLEGLGVDLTDQHLIDTPKRATKGYMQIFEGYNQNPNELFTVFDEATYDQMIIVGPIKEFSMCSHHILPFNMDIYIAYIPNQKIAGISKFVRISRAIAHKLQVQERITEEIADVVEENLKPEGVMVLIENSKHSCMTMRGVKCDSATVSTSAIRGKFKDSKVRDEFFNTIRK
jgi:GTP cyclohydrolase I